MEWHKDLFFLEMWEGRDQTRYVLLNFNPLSGLETRCRKTQSV